jgi:hypothetical protein
VVAVARSLDDWWRDDCLEPIIYEMTTHPQLTARAIELAGSLTKSYSRDDVLSGIVDRILDQPGAEEAALHAADMIESGFKRIKALAAVAERSSAPNTYLEKALEVVAALPNDSDRARALAELGATLVSSQSLLHEAMKIAIELKEECRAHAIGKLAGQFAKYPELVKQAETAISDIQKPVTRAKALAMLAEYMPEEKQARMLQDALEHLSKDRWDTGFHSAVATVIKMLAGRPVLLDRTLELADRESSDWFKANILEGIIDQSADEPQILEKALDSAMSITSESERTEAATLIGDLNQLYLTVGALLATLDGEARGESLTKVIEETKQVLDSERRAQVLIILAQQLHHDLNNVRTVLEAGADIEGIPDA